MRQCGCHGGRLRVGRSHARDGAGTAGRGPPPGRAIPIRSQGRARCWSRSRPAGSAAPTYMWWTGSCRSRSCRWCRGTNRRPRAAPAAPASRRWLRRTRVGVPWLGTACGACVYCRSGAENLCDAPGLHRLHARWRLCRALRRGRGLCLSAAGGPSRCRARTAALRRPDRAPLSPLWRGRPRRLGIYGFGAAAHIVAQVARFEGRRRSSPSPDRATRPAQDFARRLGAVWAGGSDEAPPAQLDAAIIFAPVGALVPKALRAVRKGGRVVCGGIHMSDIPSFPYADLWGERASARSQTSPGWTRQSFSPSRPAYRS